MADIERTVLLVDDDEGNRKLGKEILELDVSVPEDRIRVAASVLGAEAVLSALPAESEVTVIVDRDFPFCRDQAPHEVGPSAAAMAVLRAVRANGHKLSSVNLMVTARDVSLEKLGIDAAFVAEHGLKKVQKPYFNGEFTDAAQIAVAAEVSFPSDESLAVAD